MKIFIADDFALIRKSLKAVLEDIPGVEIVGLASRGDEAFEGIMTSMPQLVILDIHMPPTSGIDVLERIKKKTNPPMVAIFTESDISEYRKKCSAAGADYFFVKSMGHEDLIALVRQLAIEAA